MQTKHGMQLEGLPQAILVIVFVGLIAVVGMQIHTQLQTTSLDSYAHNETIAMVNNTYNALTFSRIASVSNIGNATEIMLPANYSVFSNATGSSIYLMYSNGTGAAGALKVDGNYWVLYTYNKPDSAWLASANTTEGINNVTQQLPLLGLILIMSVVIMLLWTSFKFGDSGGM